MTRDEPEALALEIGWRRGTRREKRKDGAAVEAGWPERLVAAGEGEAVAAPAPEDADDLHADMPDGARDRLVATLGELEAIKARLDGLLRH